MTSLLCCRQSFFLNASDLSLNRGACIAHAPAYRRRSVTILRNVASQKSWLRSTKTSSSENPSTSKLLSETTAVGPEGILLFGFPKNEVKAVQSWLSSAGIKVVSGDGLLNRASSVSDAVALLENTEIELLTDNAEDVFTGFSRVVLFSGFPGTVIEGLVDVWREELSDGPISYAFSAPSMMNNNLEETLLKVIRATDEHELDAGAVDASSKDQLKSLLANLSGQEKPVKGSKTRSTAKSQSTTRGFGKST